MIHDEGGLETPRLNLCLDQFINQLLLIKVVSLKVLLCKILNLGKDYLSNFLETIFLAKYRGVNPKFSAHVILRVRSPKVIFDSFGLVGGLPRVFTPGDHFRIHVKLWDEDLSAAKQLDCQLAQQVFCHRH